MWGFAFAWLNFRVMVKMGGKGKRNFEILRNNRQESAKGLWRKRKSRARKGRFAAVKFICWMEGKRL